METDFVLLCDPGGIPLFCSQRQEFAQIVYDVVGSVLQELLGVSKAPRDADRGAACALRRSHIHAQLPDRKSVV